MDRTHRTALFFALLSIALAVASCERPRDAKRSAAPKGGLAPPNVLIIVTDDQRTQTMSVMPATRRWFGRGGVTFRNGYVTTPLCCPSRASIFTGQYVHNHGVDNNGLGRQLPQSRTLQRYLHDAGYFTAIAGKYLNGVPPRIDPPNFDRWATGGVGYFDTPFNVGGKVRTVHRYSVDFVGDKSVHFLEGFEQEDDKPWFLYVAPHAPHLPSTPERRYSNSRVPVWRPSPAVGERDRSDKPPWIRSREAGLKSIRARRRDQLRTLMSADDLVDRLFHAMGRLDEQRRTLAFFVSDNGYLWGEHGVVSKRWPYERSTRVPMFMRWPGHIPAGRTDNRLAANIDIAPTVVAAAGITPPVAMDGWSLLGSHRRAVKFVEFYRDIHNRRLPGWASIRRPRFHYIEYYGSDRRSIVFREYYRLPSDPWQLVNVFRDGDPSNNPDAARLQRLVRRHSSCEGASCP